MFRDCGVGGLQCGQGAMWVGCNVEELQCGGDAVCESCCM